MNPVPSPNQSLTNDLMRRLLIQNENQQIYNQNQDAKNQLIFDQIGILAKALHERYQGALPGNTKPNQREKVNSIMTRSGLTTTEPSIPPHVPLTPRVEVEKEPETLMDEVHITSPASTAHVL
ncbi:hypothetical protein Tco_0801107 [Tanacetum coccineum]|uniref:Uncharacterized protein n=1 Tax=Tanacetum coccineum TaxID=301880 RepID=A0ABQ4ZV10_9ASTR